MIRVMKVFSLMGLLAGLLALVAACGSTAPAAPSASSAGPGSSGASAPSNASGNTPRLTVDKPVIDFGKVAYGQKVTPVWKLTNSGNAPLQIKDIQLDVKEGC